ncbi:porin [Pseudomonas entomophila]|uniref:ShlB/FhaC/HecB family hemolysin secretion/activation protein n=1 Tax=Pseudomonas entomophila TaxID=312306 RepID=UPI0023D7E954|nr:porin [Pseudomonas entomophila]MDF0730769.1 porin [Pseudomonas entomophila]
MTRTFLTARVRRALHPHGLSLLAATLLASPAQAEPLPNAGTLFDSNRDSLRPAQQPQQAPRGSVRIEAPGDERQADAAQPGPSVRFKVSAFQLTGNRELSTSRLQEALQADVGQELDLPGLRAAAARITALYRSRGYLVARAYLPPQEIDGGVVAIDVREGQVGDVRTETAPGVRLNAAMQQRFIDALPRGSVIREQDLERVLLRLSDIAGVSVRAVLQPSRSPGAADIVLKLSEMTAFTGRVSADNHGNYYTGSGRVSTNVSLNDALGFGESLYFNTQNSFEGLEIRGVGLRQPLGASGVSVGASYAEMNYTLGKGLKTADAEGNAQVSALFLDASLLRSRDANIGLNLAQEHRRFEDAAGAFEVRKAAVFRGLTLYGDWRDGWAGSNRWSLGYGIGRLDKRTPLDEALDALTAEAAGTYHKGTLSFSRLQALGGGFSLYAAISGQWAGKNLDSSEKFTLGGPNGVRAYGVGEAAGDEGVLGRLELRKYLGRFNGAIAEGALFADAGRVRVNKKPWDDSDNSLSRHGYGVGLNVYHRDLVMNASVAFSNGDQPTSDEHDARRFWLSVSGSPQAFAGLAKDLGTREDFRDKSTELTLYGSLGLVPEYIDRRDATRAGPADQTRLATPNGRNMSSYWRARDNVSYVGARAGIPMTDTSRILWQLEYGISVNYTLDGDQSAPKSISPNTRLRNSAVALDDDRYGTLLYGNWDMPLKESTTNLDPFAGKTAGAYYNIIGSPGFSVGLASNVNGPAGTADTSENSDAAFNRRQNGVVAWWSPEWHGLSLKLAYSNNGMKAAEDVGNGYIYGASLTYKNGGFTAVAAAERHVDYFGIASLGRNARGVGSNTHVTDGTSSSDYSYRLGLGYQLGDTELSLIADELHYAEDGVINNSLSSSDLSEYSRRAYLLGVTHRLGAWRLRASYGRALAGECKMVSAAGFACDTQGMGARQYALGVGYRFNRNTEVFAHYVLLKNEALANYNFAVVGAFAASGYSPGVGTTINAIGTGINYSF